MLVTVHNKSPLHIFAFTLLATVTLWSMEARACGPAPAGTVDGDKVPKCRGVQQKPRLPRLFSDKAIKSLCSAIDAGSKDEIHSRMDALIEMSGSSREKWNSYHAFRIRCSGKVPLEYALARGFERFKAVADYGVALGHEFPDGEGGTSTLRDYATHTVANEHSSAADKEKWQGILKYLTEHKAKGCADQPDLLCMTRHAWAAPLKAENIFEAAMHLGRYSLLLRQLKWSNCMNKVSVEEQADADLRLISRHLGEQLNLRFSEIIMPIKEHSGADMEYKIEESKRLSGSIDTICSSLEAEYKGRYDTAKAEFFDLVLHD